MFHWPLLWSNHTGIQHKTNNLTVTTIIHNMAVVFRCLWYFFVFIKVITSCEKASVYRVVSRPAGKPTENPSGKIRLDSWAFLLTMELFERANQIVACPITPAAHQCPSTCVDMIIEAI